MGNFTENTVHLTNQDRKNNADAYKRVIDTSFISASKAKELTNKVNKKELIRLNTMEFLNNMNYTIQETAIMGKSELNVFFTEMKIKHAHVSYRLSDYDEIDWDEVNRFLHKLNYYTRIDTHKHPQQGPLASTYKVFTISWN